MKENIIYLSKKNVKSEINQSVDQRMMRVRQQLDLIPDYTKAIMTGVQSVEFSQSMAKAESEIKKNLQANPNGKVAQTAGAYFANENVLAGSMTATAVKQTNSLGSKFVPGWEDRQNKIKLGPGITFIQPPALYNRLLKMGAANPELAVNYTAPFGTRLTTQGLADILNARIKQENPYDSQTVIQTDGATEAIELALEAVSQLYPDSEVLSLGFSYYTALFTADQKKLRCSRVMPADIDSQASQEKSVGFQPNINEIRQSVSARTKTLLLTSPNNPTGETYNDEELRQLMNLVKENDLLVLFDAIFEEMFFDSTQNQTSPVLKAALEVGVLDQVIVVDSLAKRRGLAGARLGWLGTTNQSVMEVLENTILARRCNPPLIYEPVAQFEGAASLFSQQSLKNPSSSQGRLLARNLVDEKKLPYSSDEFLDMYCQWDEWRTSSQEYYRQNLQIIQAVLGSFVQGQSDTQAAFNTFIKLGENIPATDFMAKLMLLTGTYTQVGPCFGISEKVWTDQLGLWARVSFASDRGELIEGITRMIALAWAYQEYNLGDNTRYPSINISYDQQV